VIASSARAQRDAPATRSTSPKRLKLWTRLGFALWSGVGRGSTAFDFQFLEAF
jgi:hypothetical protein